MAQVIWPKRAKDWLRKIYDFIAENDPEAADSVIRSILRKCEILARFPMLGAVYRGDAGQSLRVFTHGHYRIVYKIDGSDIRIVGVFHERMDIPRHLKKPR